MSKTTKRWVVLILLLGCDLFTWTISPQLAHPAAVPPRAERPTYSLGEKWIRNDGAYRLVRIDRDRYVFVAGPGQEIHLTRDLMVARVQQAQLFIEFDPPPRLTWPLQVGNWGASEGMWRIRDFPEGFRSSFTWSIDAYEEVHVPAGIFKVFRISLSWAHKTIVHYSGTLRAWYAPDLRQFVKAEGTGSAPLLAFEIIDTDRPATTPGPPIPSPPKPQAEAERPRSLEDRLRVLKDLREKNLITEEQYQTTTRELLKKLME